MNPDYIVNVNPNFDNYCKGFHQNLIPAWYFIDYNILQNNKIPFSSQITMLTD